MALYSATLTAGFLLVHDDESRWGNAIPFQTKIRALAAQLVGSADAGYAPPQSSFPAFERLQRSLNSMAGAAGARALLYRALTLSKAELPRLAPVTLNRKGCLEGLSDIDPPLSHEEADTGELLLVGNFIELLCVFLGDAIALRFIQNEWPDASFGHEESGKERTA